MRQQPSSCLASLNSLSLAQKVAQLFMIGYSGKAPDAMTLRFIQQGVGGLIFFRDNFQHCQSPLELAELMQQRQQQFPGNFPRPFLAIDQEGGQVERLPHRCFPTLLTPRAVALSKNPEKLAVEMYAIMAKALKTLGFNLNFFPTLDLNQEVTNPIIGVRSFGDDADTVKHLSTIAQTVFLENGLIAVGKHFPGHGNGTVDSHLDLPQLHFTPEELSSFQHAIDKGLPAMLVAHGLYPALQPQQELISQLPSSASPAIIKTLLREQCGFKGLVITDDMCMGAITRYQSPVEAAIASLKAGVDILLYKQGTPAEWEVYEAVVHAFQSGELPMDDLEQRLTRIALLKEVYTQPVPTALNPDLNLSGKPEAMAQPEKIALNIAKQGITLIQGVLPKQLANPNSPLLLVHPDRQGMGNYAFDSTSSPSLDDWFRQAGYTHLQQWVYSPLLKEADFSEDRVEALLTENKADSLKNELLPDSEVSPETLVFVSWTPYVNTFQSRLYQWLVKRYPNTGRLLVAAGSPEYPPEMVAEGDAVLVLGSYRPASMQALPLYCTGQPCATK